MPYKPGGTPALLSHGSKNHSTRRKSRKPPKITPATVISGIPATFIWAIGEASNNSFFLYGKIMAAMAVPKYMMAMPWVAASVMDLNPATLYAYMAETMIAGTTMSNMAFTGVPFLFNSAAFSGSKRSNAAAKITRVEERNKVPAHPNHHVLINNKTTI